MMPLIGLLVFTAVTVFLMVLYILVFLSERIKWKNTEFLKHKFRLTEF
jgi:hypothetical protein